MNCNALSGMLYCTSTHSCQNPVHLLVDIRMYSVLIHMILMWFQIIMPSVCHVNRQLQCFQPSSLIPTWFSSREHSEQLLRYLIVCCSVICQY